MERQQPGKLNTSNQGLLRGRGATSAHAETWVTYERFGPHVDVSVHALPRLLNARPEHTEIRGLLVYPAVPPRSSNLFPVCSPAIDQQKNPQGRHIRKKTAAPSLFGDKAGDFNVYAFFSPSDDLAWLEE